MSRFCNIFSRLLQLFSGIEFQQVVMEANAERHAGGFEQHSRGVVVNQSSANWQCSVLELAYCSEPAYSEVIRVGLTQVLCYIEQGSGAVLYNRWVGTRKIRRSRHNA
jgi:hypothetical protein